MGALSTAHYAAVMIRAIPVIPVIPVIRAIRARGEPRMHPLAARGDRRMLGRPPAAGSATTPDLLADVPR